MLFKSYGSTNRGRLFHTESRSRVDNEWEARSYAASCGKNDCQYSCLWWQEEGSESWLSQKCFFKTMEFSTGTFSVIHFSFYLI